MQCFRQVLTPHGVFYCTGYRSVPMAKFDALSATTVPSDFIL